MKNKYALSMVGFVLLSLSGLVTAQEPTDLFIEMENLGVSSMPTSTMEKGSGILSKNKVNVNVQALRVGSPIQKVQKSHKRGVNANSGKGFLMQLPDGTLVTLITNRLQSFVKGVETYTGQVRDIESGFFTLSIEKDKVFGQVNIEYMAYDIRYDKTCKRHPKPAVICRILK